MTETTQLSAKILEQLKPDLRVLCSRLSCELASRIAELLSRAVGLRIDPNRLVKYALLLVAAEREVVGAAISSEHTARARAELAGKYHGFEEGYEKQEEARQRHRHGRKARQRIAASLSGVLRSWKKAQHVIGKNRRDLPMHAQTAVSAENLKVVADALYEIYWSIELGNAHALKGGSREKGSTLSIQTYVLWHNVMPKYKGKWKEMHELARAWRLTRCRGTDSFRLMVLRNSSEVEQLSVPFGRAWMAAFAEDG
jgi:hypothetical protein